MKYVIIGDPHINFTGYSLVIDDIPEQVYFPCLNLRKAAEKAKEINGELIIAGDLIEEKEKIHQVVLYHLIETLKYCSSLVPTYIVLGNHDYITYNNFIFTYLYIMELCNIQVAFPGNPLFIQDAVLIGHTENRELLAEDFQKIDLNSIKLIVAHFGLQEAVVGNTKYKGGEFSVKDFKQMKNTFMILGHYHKPQKVSENIYYVGSPTPLRVDERDDEKRFLIFDTETMELESIPTVYPKYKTIELDYKSEIDTNMLENDIIETYNKYVFVFPPDHPQNLEIKKLQNKFKGYVHTYTKPKQDAETENDVPIIDVKKTVTIESIADEFLEKSNVPVEKRDFYKKVALEK